MSKIPTIIEQQLANLNPAGLDGDFLERLTANAEGTYLDISQEEAAFENELRALRPVHVSAVLSASLLETLGDTPFAVDEKIVLFNKPAYGAKVARPRGAFRFNLAAAAAVALLGSIAAFMVPAGTTEKQGAENVAAPEPVAAQLVAGSTSPVATLGFSPNLGDSRDMGVVWRGKHQPHRIIRRTYLEQDVVEDNEGNSVPVMRPRVEYIIIPEKID